ncbi:MPPalpha1 [Symbiodinium natans]|uniref:MPPalpha1 protein n=1 Tax=Symbiodinium natans TaxID=878477 RepID=A0A812RLQ1_9DINO|nr:MPPalpha1 [Symbiodinium natans]
MPDLVLGGHAQNYKQENPYRGVPLDHAVVVDEVRPSATEEGFPQPLFGRLPNGVKVIAVDRQGLCTSLGLFVQAGSRYGSAEQACLPHMLELMAFRSSAHLTHLRTQKTLEQLGAAASCRVGREDVLYQVDVLREYVPVALPLMLANVLCPLVLPDEVAESHQHIAELQQMLEDKPESLVVELLHVAAYQGNSLGYPLYATEQDLDKCSADSIREFIARECTPDTLTVVGVNVDFAELCKWTARSFAEQGSSFAGLPEGATRGDMVPAKYTGGELRMSRPNPLCHLIFGWEVPGGWNGKWLAAATVLQMFLGGGGSFSTGGPGKGMHTRFFTEILNRHHWVESCQASTVMYIDSGLFTVYATTVPDGAKDFVDVLARVFEGVMRMTPLELDRAKNALASSIHMNLEMRAVMMEDLGRQMVLSGKVGSAMEFTRMVGEIEKEDLIEVLRVCLMSRVSVVAFGAIEKVPSFESIEKRFSELKFPVSSKHNPP